MKHQFQNSAIVGLFIVFFITLTSLANRAETVNSNNLDRLKKSFNLSRDAWLLADIETYLTFVYLAAKSISHNGYTSIIKEKKTVYAKKLKNSKKSGVNKSAI